MIEKPVVEVVGIIVFFVRNIIYDSVVKDLRILRYLFNNFKWFESIWLLKEPYKVFNVNCYILYDIRDIVKLTF